MCTETKQTEKVDGSSWKVALGVALLVAVITSILNYAVYIAQFDIQKTESHRTKRIELISKASAQAQRYIYLKQFQIRMLVQQSRFAEDQAESNKRIDINTFFAGTTQLKEKHPFEYKQSLTLQEFSPAFSSTLITSQFIFEEPAKSALINLQGIVGDEYVEEFMKSNKIDSAKSIDDLALLYHFNKDADRRLIKALEAMADQL